MAQLFANNADSILAAGISNVATTLTVQSGDGAKFPSPVGADYFLLTIYHITGVTESGWEVVKCTSRTADVLTIVRGQEGTTAGAFSASEPVSARWTAGSAGGVLQAQNNLSDLTNASIALTNLGVVGVSFTTTSLTYGAAAAAFRMLGDFGNATPANRPMFQSNVLNNNTRVQAIPNGTGTVAQYVVSNASDPANCLSMQFSINASQCSIQSTVTGTGTLLPMCFAPGAVNSLVMGAAGDTSIVKGFGRKVTSYNFAASPVTLGMQDHVVIVDATSGNISLTLPAANAYSSSFAALSAVGQEIVFIRIDNTANTVTVNRAGSDTIGAAATSKTIAGGTPTRVTFQSDTSSKWWAAKVWKSHYSM